MNSNSLLTGILSILAGILVIAFPPIIAYLIGGYLIAIGIIALAGQ